MPQTSTSVALTQAGGAQAGGSGGAGAGVATTTGVPVGGTPLPNTAAELRNLVARRNEISNQLTNVSSRREDLARELRNASPGADRAGLENRIGVLDNRLRELETQLDITGKQVIAAKGIIAVDPDPPDAPPGQILNSGQITAISIVFTLAVLMPLSMAWARAFLRRSKAQSEAPSRQLTDRLDRMEEGIEAIAIEVERVSEGQRFVTKVLGAGAAQPVSVEQKERVVLER